MTLAGGAAMFDDLDDPSPPVPAPTHRVEVDRRIRRIRHQRRAMIGGLAVVIIVGATFTAINVRTSVPVRSALKPTPSATHNQMSWPSVSATPDLSQAQPGLSTFGPSGGTGTQNGTTASGGTGSSGAAGATSAPAPAPALAPPAAPAPCPAHSPDPSWQNGRYCGPAPHAGNGSGPNGLCSGRETTPPCGRGVVVGKYYAYTLPERCDGRITFDGRLWDSEMPPPANGPDLWVWMRLDPSGELRFISPEGTVGFTPDNGQPPPSCAGTPMSTPSSTG
jgi:hypothetical protein